MKKWNELFVEKPWILILGGSLLVVIYYLIDWPTSYGGELIYMVRRLLSGLMVIPAGLGFAILFLKSLNYDRVIIEKSLFLKILVILIYLFLMYLLLKVNPDMPFRLMVLGGMLLLNVIFMFLMNGVVSKAIPIICIELFFWFISRLLVFIMSGAYWFYFLKNIVKAAKYYLLG